jgi:NAD+ kinase
MATIAFLLHHERPQATELARDAVAWLGERGHEVRVPAADAEVAGLEELSCRDDELAHELDLAVSLGGDGTMLRTVDLVADAGVPVLGVNVGQLGYLTEVEPQSMRMALKRFLAGSYSIESRMMLDVSVESASGDCEQMPGAALNEAVLEKTPMGHTVRLEVTIDGDFFTTYAADGLIVATPTGSTAYSFSARGPIVAPEHRAILLTPVSPHMLFDRTMVLEPDSSVRLEVTGHRPATLSMDGRNLGTLHEGDAIVCTSSRRSARLVTFGGRNFHDILKAKFGLNDR